jgi:enoyl-CoA hydratase/carnithine racemase
MEERLSAAGGEILAAVRGSVATVTLNRPAALNALTLGMIEGLARWLDAWEHDPRIRMVVLRGAGERAFCSGGDIRVLHDNRGTAVNAHFMAAEYALDYRIHTYPKPTVAFIDGIVMGGGMGLAQGAKLRIVGERTRMAMPETAIGLFPDVGGSWFLSRTPGHVGLYLGLAGPTIGAADALYCGLADRYVGGAPLGPGEVERMRLAIDRHFGQPGVAAILESLRAESSPEFAEWAARTVTALERSSPTMLGVTFEQIRRGATMSLAECFRMELNLILAAFEHGDFVEGIRAMIVDKDRNPRWSPATLAEVDPAAVQRFFNPRWSPARHPLANLESRAA